MQDVQCRVKQYYLLKQWDASCRPLRVHFKVVLMQDVQCRVKPYYLLKQWDASCRPLRVHFKVVLMQDVKEGYRVCKTSFFYLL